MIENDFARVVNTVYFHPDRPELMADTMVQWQFDWLGNETTEQNLEAQKKEQSSSTGERSRLI
ncbi:MAG: hypothetical protein IH587_08685 [Anaerolineae bacterium]|nr:hypothetical protein [Anaerolineae bacterium]